jgi:hypothetical protein
VTLVLDAGALIAVERGDRTIAALLKRERRAGRPPVSHGGVVGQVWRGGSGRQENLAKFLAGVNIVPLDDRLGRRAGVLLGRTATGDVIDAAVVLLADHDDQILTSDVNDLTDLAVAAGIDIELVPI